MSREKVIEAIKKFPQEFQLEELMERLIFIENVEKGLKPLEEGKTLPHQTVREMVSGKF